MSPERHEAFNVRRGNVGADRYAQARSPKDLVVVRRQAVQVQVRNFNRTGVVGLSRRVRESGALRNHRGTRRGEEHEDQDPSVRRVDQGACRSAGRVEWLGAAPPRSRHGVVYRCAGPNRRHSGGV
ncbi:hypothetical protein NSPZN2_110051 [Nitrospira defluvii]|uniref:Uncharacterized protein n=1 Tax=Nitrospira defluvii TaxID=330214 RepID=A0ABM8R7E2_9BACT|nr:hypothetical protein NSPZN2_110051 [Nitrospira defluvii]